MPRRWPRRLGVSGDPQLSQLIYERIVEKLRREPVEDFRLDFEDGYGNRADAEEDGHAAAERRGSRARTCGEGTLPPFIGIRIKPLNEDLRARSMRTLDIFVTALRESDGRKLAGEFRHHGAEDSAARAGHRGGPISSNSLEKKTGLPTARCGSSR